MSFFLFKMKECECLKNKRIRPFDSCIYCAHKHATSALALTNLINDDNKLIKLRIISQLNLSSWHLNKSFYNLNKKYQLIINKILKNEDFKDELTNLVEFLWIQRNNRSNDIQTKENFNLSEKTIINGLIFISNALELLKYENTYLNINYSYAIGQLNLAMWCFQEINETYAQECRELYKFIESDNINFNKIENFMKKIIFENNIFN